MRISDWSSDVCSSDLLYDIEAIIKILTKPARLNFFLQLAVCGGDDAHVDLQRHACADRLRFAIFYDAQQLHLRIHRQFTDFVQKNCAPIGVNEPPDLTLECASECPAFMAEQFGFDEIGWDRTAIHRNHALLETGRGRVNRDRKSTRLNS